MFSKSWLGMGLMALVVVGAGSLAPDAPRVAAQSGGTTLTRFAALTGSAPAKGQARFRMRANGRTDFSVEVQNVNLPNGTALLVTVNGAAVGQIAVALGRGQLQLESERGQAVPAVSPGTIVSVIAPNGMLVVSGRF